MNSRVTTKQGDAGHTRALSGDHYSKSHLIMECVGSVDELRAHTALARIMVLQERAREQERVANFLLWLMHTYFLVGTECSDPLVRRPEYRRCALASRHLTRLETEQMRMESRIDLGRAFIVSATNVVSAQIDVAATFARRLERNVVRLKEDYREFDAAMMMVFLNRLSDTLYILARYLDGPKLHAVDYAALDHESNDEW